MKLNYIAKRIAWMNNLSSKFCNSTMPFNLPFVQLTRNMVLDNVAVSECKAVKISGGFLCGIKSVTDSRSLPENVTRQEKAALFHDLLINPTISKNTSPSSYNQFISTTESCSDCLSLIKEVCALRQRIVDLKKELENRLEESRRKYLNGCEILGNSLTVGRIKLHAGGQDNSSTLSTVPGRKFSPMQMSPEVEDDESIGPEEEEDMSSEFDEEEEDKPPEFVAEKENMSIDEEEEVTPSEFQEEMSSKFDQEEEYTPSNGKPAGTTMQSKNEHSNNATINPSANTNGLICPRCGMTFSRNDTLRRHEMRQVCKKTRNPQKIEGAFSCSKCFLLFPTRIRQIIHEMHVCKVVFTQEQVHPMTLYTCSLCDKQFVKLYDYQRHYGSHAEVKKSVDLDKRPRRHRDNHARNVSFDSQKSVDSVRQHQDMLLDEEEEDMSSEFDEEEEDKPPEFIPDPLRNVRPNTEKEISTYEPLLGGKLTIHHCPRCTRWFVKEDNLKTHLATDHNHDAVTSQHSDTDNGEVMHIRKPRKAEFCARVIKKTEDKTTRKKKRPAIPKFNPNVDFSTASIELVENYRAKYAPKLKVNGYLYSFEKFGSNKRIWACGWKSKEKCPARLHTSMSLSPVEILGEL